jgi:hypothetical protein
MYNQHVTHLPASWVEVKVDSESSIETNGVTDGTDGQTNGYSNGHLNGTAELPESFLTGKAVRTVYGPVPLKYALDWPIFASYDELTGCASYMGGRIPTFEEARSIYRYAEIMKGEKAERQLGKTVPAVNGYETTIIRSIWTCALIIVNQSPLKQRRRGNAPITPFPEGGGG